MLVCQSPPLIKHQRFVIAEHPLQIQINLISEKVLMVMTLDGSDLFLSLVQPLIKLRMNLFHECFNLKHGKALPHLEINW